jgi:tRNA(fMet)-specific endonuclease VapC
MTSTCFVAITQWYFAGLIAEHPAVARIVLDANTISYILRKDLPTVAKLREAAAGDAEILVSPMAYYEVRRGLLHIGAVAKIRDLERLFATMLWSDFVGRPVWEDAAELWADAERRGRPQSDGDVLIAAHARAIDATVVTHNPRDFGQLAVRTIDWAPHV